MKKGNLLLIVLQPDAKLFVSHIEKTILIIQIIQKDIMYNEMHIYSNIVK